MGVLALSAVLNHSESTGVDRLIMLAIADCADDHGEAYTSERTLKQWSNSSFATLMNAVDRMEQRGEISGDITQWRWQIHLPGLLPTPMLRRAS